MKELDTLLTSTSIDELLEMDLDEYSKTELEYLFKKVDATADQLCYDVGFDYNIKDVQLVKRLDDKLKLLDLTFTMAYDAGINFNDVSSQTKSWDVLIYNELRTRNMVIPSKEYVIGDSDGYAGAYVKEPITGLHEWIVSFDLASLYPHLIMQYSISPELIVSSDDIDTRIQDLESIL